MVAQRIDHVQQKHQSNKVCHILIGNALHMHYKIKIKINNLNVFKNFFLMNCSTIVLVRKIFKE